MDGPFLHLSMAGMESGLNLPEVAENNEFGVNASTRRVLIGLEIY